MIKPVILTRALFTDILQTDRMRCILFIIVVCSCSNSKEDAPHHQHAFVARVFPSEYAGFGYDIHQGNKLIIHQPIIPAIAYNKGFATRQSAQKMAALVITKLEQGLMPPAVTADEVNAILKE